MLKRKFAVVLATGEAPAGAPPPRSGALAGGAPAGSRPATVVRQPANIAPGKALKPHQLLGLNWLLALWAIGTNGILADVSGRRRRRRDV